MDDFYPKKHRVCYRLLGLLQAEHRVGPDALLAWLREEDQDPLFGEPAHTVVARLEIAGSLATSAAITACVESILDRAGRRRPIQEFTQATDAAYNGTPPALLATRVGQTLARVAERLQPKPATGLGLGLGQFLQVVDTEPESYIDGLLSDDGGGWIGGEEKLGKSFFAVDEALCLALGLAVCRKFRVPRRRRVFFLEEEDSPRRMRRRLRALLRGHVLDPEDPDVAAELDRWFHLEAWPGFTFEKRDMVARLETTLATFELAVVYIDVLRKVTLRDLNKQAEAMDAICFRSASRSSLRSFRSSACSCSISSSSRILVASVRPAAFSSSADIGTRAGCAWSRSIASGSFFFAMLSSPVARGVGGCSRTRRRDTGTADRRRS